MSCVFGFQWLKHTAGESACMFRQASARGACGLSPWRGNQNDSSPPESSSAGWPSGTKMNMWTTPQQCFQKQVLLFLRPAPAYLWLENSHSKNKLKEVHISSAKKNLVGNWSSLASAVLLHSRRKSLGLAIFAIIQHNGMLNCVNRLDNFQE